MLCQQPKKRLVAIGLAAIGWVLVVSGCSTSPRSEQRGRLVPRGRISQPDITVPSSERNAIVSFLRDKGSIDAKCTHNILVNGRRAFSIRNGESQTIYLGPGEYFIGMESSGGACPHVAISERVTLGKRGEQTYRIFSPNGYGAQLIRIK
jgi:hypothetical protein